MHKYTIHLWHYLRMDKQWGGYFLWKKLLWYPYVNIYNDVTPASWCLKSQTTRLFVQQHAQGNIEENAKAVHWWPFWGEPLIKVEFPSTQNRANTACSLFSCRDVFVFVIQAYLQLYSWWDINYLFFFIQPIALVHSDFNLGKTPWAPC